jgi:hypothetical protein
VYPLIKESQYFASSSFAPRLFVGQNSIRGRNQNVTKLTTGQQIDDPLFKFTVFDIETRRNYTALVETSRQLNDNFVGSVIINDLEFTNVTCSMTVRQKSARE